MDSVIVRHKKTNFLYKHIEWNVFRNIITGVEGNVPEEISKNIFSINLDATVLINKYPIVEQLIKKAELKIEL